MKRLTLAATAALALPLTVTPAVALEEDSGTWDCKRMGNGVCGTVDYSHWTPAEHAQHDALEREAWKLWDAVEAAKLLPEEPVIVDFTGYNTTGFPNLTADQITAWDTQGNHYLFTLTP